MKTKCKAQFSVSEVASHEAEMLKRRQARNRKTAHLSRLRKKHQVELLNRQIAELSAEAQALRLEIAATWQVSGPYNLSCSRHLYSLIAALQDTATPEEEIRRILDDIVRDLNAEGKDRVESLQSNFLAMLEALVPSHIHYFLWRNSHIPPHVLVRNLEAQLQLNGNQKEILANSEAILAEYQAQLSTGIAGLTAMVRSIAKHARVVTALIDRSRDVFRPRQSGLFLLWLYKNYEYLNPEEVLNFGQSSSMLLQGE